MKERVLQSKILQALRRYGGWWIKYHVPPRYGTAGVPDILGCYRGIFVAMEVKRPGGDSPTPLQQEQINSIRRDGRGIAIVVQSVDEALGICYKLDRARKVGKHGKAKR